MKIARASTVHLRYNEDEEKPAKHDLPGVNDSLASTALTTEALGFAMSDVGGMSVQSEEVYKWYGKL